MSSCIHWLNYAPSPSMSFIGKFDVESPNKTENEYSIFCWKSKNNSSSCKIYNIYCIVALFVYPLQKTFSRASLHIVEWMFGVCTSDMGKCPTIFLQGIHTQMYLYRYYLHVRKFIRSGLVCHVYPGSQSKHDVHILKKRLQSPWKPGNTWQT